MKIFATCFPFVEPGAFSGRMGRYVANYEFLKALLNFSHFDKFHLFCLNPEHMQATINTLVDDKDISDDAKAKIDVMLSSHLVPMLQNTPYHCCHLGGWGYFYAGTAQLRNNYAVEPFPITGVIHSLNSRETSFDIYKLIKAPIQSYDAIVCSSHCGKETMRKKLQRCAAIEQTSDFQGKLEQIPLGVDASFDQLPSRESSKKALGIDDDRLNILYLGRLSPSTKADIYPLLLTLQRLKESTCKNFRLVIAGGASDSEVALHQQMIAELNLTDIVLLKPNFDPGQKRQLYCASDICVAPSDNIQETFGISIIEAMICGLPIIASDLNGYSELIEHGSNGYKVTTTWIDEFFLASMDEILPTETLQTLLAQSMVLDLDELHNYLKLLLDDDDLRKKIGETGKAIANQKYRWQTIIAQYETLWDSLKSTAMNCPHPVSTESIFTNDYLNTFSHYPSRQLKPELLVSITEQGLIALKNQQLPGHYNDCKMAFNEQWLAQACHHLSSSPSATVGNLLEKFGDEGNSGRFTLLWAAKYGLLKIH